MKEYIKKLDQIKYQLLQNMIQNGKLQNYQDVYTILSNIQKNLLNMKDYNIEDLIMTLTDDYANQAREFVEENKCPGISVGIKTLNGPEVNVYYGETSNRSDAVSIDETVRFDGASITKKYTALQYLIESYHGKYTLDQPIATINPEFQQKTSLRELLTFYHVFHTDGKLEVVCNTEQEARTLLKTAKIIKSNTFYYSDIPYMIASYVDPDFATRFQEIFVNQMNLTQTSYEVAPSDSITGGAMNELSKVHDPKARVLKYGGHAGIYTTTHDSLKLFDCLMKETHLPISYLNQIAMPILKGDFLTDENSIAYQEMKQTLDNEDVIRYQPIWINKAMGVYRKHGLGLDKTDVLPWQSEFAFAADGFTGIWENYDLKNQFATNIFTNPLSGNEEGKKPPRYVYMLDDLKCKSLETVIALQYAQQLFETYYESDDAFQKRYIK